MSNENEILKNIASQIINIDIAELTVAEKNIAKILKEVKIIQIKENDEYEEKAYEFVKQIDNLLSF